jgi:hypothetical protein
MDLLGLFRTLRTFGGLFFNLLCCSIHMYKGTTSSVEPMTTKKVSNQLPLFVHSTVREGEASPN